MDNEKNNTRNNPSKNSGNTAGSNFFDSLLNDIQKADDQIKGSGGQPRAKEATRVEESARQAAAEDAARAAAEQARAEEAARVAAEKARAEEAARAAAEQARAEEAARAAAEKARAEDAARAAAEQARAEEAARAAAEQARAEEAARAAAEKARAEEAARAAVEKARAEEAARAAAEKARAEEAARAAAEQTRAEEAARQAAIEKAQKEAKERLAQIEAEKRAAQLAAEEEKARQAAMEKARVEEAERQAALEKAKAEEAARQAALEEAARKAEEEEPEYAELNFTDPTAAASAAIAMKLAGAGDDPDDHSTVIADEKLEQSSYRSLTGEEEARLAAEKAEAERIAAEKAAAEKAEAERIATEKAAAEKAEAKRKAEEQARAEEAARQAAIKKARAKEAQRIAALEQAKAEDAARDAAFRKEASEQKVARPTDPAAARKAPAGNNAEKPSAQSGKTAAAGAAASAAAKKDSAGSAGAKASTGSGRPATGTGKPAAGSGKSAPTTGKPATGSGKSAPANGKPAPAAGKPAAKSRKPAPDSSADTAKSGKPAPAAEKPAAKSRKPAAAATADTAKAKKTAAPDSKPVKPKKDRSPGKIISIVHLVLSVLTVLLLLIANVLPIPLLLIITAGLAAIWFLTRMFRTEHAGRFRRLLGAALSIFMCFVLVLSSAMLLRLNVTLKSITGVNSQIATFGVYALVDDSAETIKDVKDDTFGVLEAQSRAMTDDAIGQINKEVGRTINTANYADASALANGLMNGECRTIIMNESFMDVITDTDGYGDFESKTKEIASYTCTSILESRLSQSHSPDVITMYITGIDTFGDISTTSRSDVNIIAVANTKTRQVLLVSTPRDYYVPLSISNGIPDKLTHAGIYGVNVSMDTLGMLYGIDMDYYFRINFDGFKEVIDALDGVTIWSDNEFDAGGNHYVQGYNTLNGEQALAFARERHSFASGDRQRGKNQMAVIQAVIQKLQTPAILNNYNDLLKGLEGSFETDLPSTRITGLVKQQLAKPGSWNVVQYSVDGTGDMNTTFSMNQRLYVMVPDQSTVDTAKRMIEMVDNGAVITSQQ